MQTKSRLNDAVQPAEGRNAQRRSSEQPDRAEGTDRRPEPSTELSDDVGGMRCPSGRRPIDLVHLSVQTFGDRQLEGEVLILLKAQLEGAGARLMAADAKTRGLMAHALKGAALNMGAFPLAQAADSLEVAPDDDERLADILAIIAVTGAMIDQLIA